MAFRFYRDPNVPKKVLKWRWEAEVWDPDNSLFEWRPHMWYYGDYPESANWDYWIQRCHLQLTSSIKHNYITCKHDKLYIHHRVYGNMIPFFANTMLIYVLVEKECVCINPIKRVYSSQHGKKVSYLSYNGQLLWKQHSLFSNHHRENKKKNATPQCRKNFLQIASSPYIRSHQR